MAKRNLIPRVDKWLIQGLRSINTVSYPLYTTKKSEAKTAARLTFIGEQRETELKTQLYQYTPESCEVLDPYPGPQAWKKNGQLHWLNFHGLHDVDQISAVGESIPLDRQSLRYILDTTQRPKVDAFEDYLFFSVKSLLKKKPEAQLELEQMSFVLGSDYVVSFQEKVGDHFDGIRYKMREGVGFIRKRSSDYLLSQLLDALLDNYFATIESLSNEVSQIEKVVFSRPDSNTLLALELEKQNALLVRKAVVPFREALNVLLGDTSPQIRPENMKFFRDLQHSAAAALDEVEALLKTLESLTNIYYASQSQRMNETMKVLTTVATIFIPLTFIAGIYGMNFQYMPELGYRYGYPLIWAVMLGTAAFMVYYFKRKKWL